jgi:hypothetical protein
MTVLHTGSNNKFSANWANIFGKGKKSSSQATDKPTAAAKPAKAKKKVAAKKVAVAKKPAKKTKK